MSDVAMLQAAELKQILQTAIEKRVPAIMTYLSRGKWHVAKVLLTGLGSNGLNIESRPSKGRNEGAASEEESHPVNIRAYQPVGISFKYGYGKFVFDTTVVGLEPSLDATSQGRGGTLVSAEACRAGAGIVLALPDRIEVVQRRSYFRVPVPESLKVGVLLWHRSCDEAENGIQDTRGQTHDCFHGRLVDISAGGVQVMVPRQLEAQTDARPDFKKGQFVGVWFTPMPYETPLMFNAQVRNVLPVSAWPSQDGLTADDKSIHLGLQIVGLEASPEGRKVLSRLVGVVERYFKINQSSAKQQDMQSAPNFQMVNGQ